MAYKIKRKKQKKFKISFQVKAKDFNEAENFANKLWMKNPNTDNYEVE